MRRFFLVLVGVALLVPAGACNKERPRKLDYTAKEKEGLYSASGLPGEGYVGQPKSATKFVNEKKTAPESKSAPADNKKKTGRKKPHHPSTRSNS